MKKRTWQEWVLLIFWGFVFGCIFGYIHESYLHFFKHGMFESRQGLLYGPFSQVYGLGAVFFIITISQLKDWKTILIAGTFLGGGFEWLCSFIQEKVFGSISWDYSNYFLNIGGRTSLFHAICWGFIGLAFVKLISPLLLTTVKYLQSKKGWILTIIVGIFLSIDIILSILAGIRYDERQKGIKANNVLRETLDNWYPDSYMYEVYPNMKYESSN